MAKATRARAPAGPLPGGRVTSQILTPDRRLRVFVSSTLQELAEERAAVKNAIQSLRLTPVLFEIGASPYPPKSLYRAYLLQSEVFVGVYWQSGGWMAPGSKLSGIEDEYNLAKRLPRLIYIKEPAPAREPRLAAMLTRIRSAADASYRVFGSSQELIALVADDLAVLVSERFQVTTPPSAVRTSRGRRRAVGNLPVPPAALVDRLDEMAMLERFLADGGVQLTVLTGPGGVGKTRLAIEAARAVSGQFHGGVWFVSLASVRDPDQVPAAILDTLEAGPTGARSPAEALKNHLRADRYLLVLDNFEQALEAAPFLADLVTSVPSLKVLVTSRTSLHLRAEHEVPISPLRVPKEAASPAEEMQVAAVQLFVDRALATCPDFRIDESNAETVAAITRRLDGLPLGIELAAARCRLLSPAELLSGLTQSLDLGGAGLRDVPDRQRTLRSTIQWSFDLLDDCERDVFMRLAAFRGGFTLQAAEAVCRTRSEIDMLDAVGSLVDGSLVQHGVDGAGSRYTMLQVVRQYALEKLEQADLKNEVAASHAAFFAKLVAAAEPGLYGHEQVQSIKAIDRDYDNIAAAMEWQLESGEIDDLAAVAWGLWPYWWAFGRLAEGRRRVSAALARQDRSELATARLAGAGGLLAIWLGDMAGAATLLEAALLSFHRVGDVGAAATILTLQALAAGPTDPEKAAALVAESGPMFAHVGNRWGLALCANVKSWLAPELDAAGRPTPHAREAVALAEESGDDVNLAMALGNLGAQELEQRDLARARDHIGRSLRLFVGLGARYGIAHIFELAAQVALLGGDAATAVEIMGSAAGIRGWVAAPIHPAQVRRHDRILAALRTASDEAEFERFWSLGRSLDFQSAVALAISACDSR